MKIVDISPFKGSTVCIELSGGGLAQNMKIYLHRDIAAEVSKGMDITEEQADMLIHKNDVRKARERALYLMESRDHSYSELLTSWRKTIPRMCALRYAPGWRSLASSTTGGMRRSCAGSFLK